MELNLIHNKNIKEVINDQDLRVSKDFYAALELHLLQHLEQCAKRAKENKRSVVMARDN